MVALLEDRATRTYCFAALDRVEFSRRSGGLTRFQSSLASLLRIKPVLKMNNGEFDMARVSTRRAALAQVVELLSELGPLANAVLIHTYAPVEAKALGREARHLVPEGMMTLFAEATPDVGTHIGPGAAGLSAIQACSQ